MQSVQTVQDDVDVVRLLAQKIAVGGMREETSFCIAVRESGRTRVT